ncbi:bifunctional 3-(3-hydroxy-phenyl)propionate/3-hydroxycinnamic acid hydroxylase [Rheinheimera muenzenbergensis]|uniref:Bifunctional 3-(3-hydroxy-phenyl)propionate/3-hydroxycinnamic acid hydroxylase n=1 Tax=Rheinheimera muenzenbergensis TaxID=1193628 RepID=A0ABU8C1H9_9GAMM
MQEHANGSSEHVFEVLIVGYGPVGAALAALLGRYGVHCLVIERLAEMVMTPRAIVLDNEALRILQLAGLAQQSFDLYGIQEVRMHCPYLGQFARLNTSGIIDGHPKLVTFYQPALEQALRSQVQSKTSVTVWTQTELLDLQQHSKGVVASVKTATGEIKTLQARYLVGADGASSRVRNLIGQAFAGETYAEDWLIVDVGQRQHLAIDHIEFNCDPRRPSPHIPAPGGRERWEFMLHPHETRDDMLQPAKIAQLMAPWLKPDELNIERQAVYRFHARCCTAFQRDSVFLVGDAAHVTPPFVGQGLVAGLRDAANLAWKLAWVTHGQASPAILSSYDTERRPHARKMINLARLMGKLVMPRSKAKAIILHGLTRLLGALPFSRTFFEELRIKPANRFKQGLFDSGKSPAGLVRGGQIAQDWLRTRHGVQLSDDVLGAQLLLVGIGTEPKQHLDTASQQAWQAAGGSYLQLGLPGQQPSGDTPFAEMLSNAFVIGKASGWLVVVRPDGVIMQDGAPEHAVVLLNQALALLNA